MQLITKVDILPAKQSIRYRDHILCLGSCFAANMANKLSEYYFQIECNPAGTLYNPVSIARYISKAEPIMADVIIVTFGTAWVYLDKKSLQCDYNADDVFPYNAVVDNCQKRPATDFIRKRLAIQDIVDIWSPVIERNKDKRFIFTVSPIRHLKDGLHENQLSKSTLVLALEKLLDKYSNDVSCAYFPAYEIMLDELRDYRFYAEDMMHPSDTAVKYIFERFTETYLYEPETLCAMKELHALWLDRQHRPLNPDSNEYKEFKLGLEKRYSNLKLKYPWL